MIVAGIDYSISSPSLCIWDTETDFTHKNFKFFVLEKSTTKKEQKRRETLSEEWKNNISIKNKCLILKENIPEYIVMADYFVSILSEYGVKKVFMESYAYAGKGKVFNLAEATGLLKTFICLSGIKIKLYEPLHVKKIFTGNGRASKERMIDSYNEKFSLDIRKIYGINMSDSPLSDIVDSAAMIYTALQMEDI